MPNYLAPNPTRDRGALPPRHRSVTAASSPRLVFAWIKPFTPSPVSFPRAANTEWWLCSSLFLVLHSVYLTSPQVLTPKYLLHLISARDLPPRNQPVKMFNPLTMAQASGCQRGKGWLTVYSCGLLSNTGVATLLLLLRLNKSLSWVIILPMHLYAAFQKDFSN